MIHNGPFARKGLEAPIDYAEIDPASVDWSLFGKGRGWKSNQRQADPVTPRVETHAFDPYAQARPDIYSFQRDTKEALTYFAQTRLDGRFIGTVETTALGNPRESVLRIFWKKNGGADIEFDMMGTTAFRTINGQDVDVPPICSGYCKKTDLGSAVPGMLGKFGWVAVATKLHGKDLRRSQTNHLFSLPLFEAIATATAFSMFRNDQKIRDMHPTLGTMAPAGIGATPMQLGIHGVGAERWMRADAADLNEMIRASSTFSPISVDGYALGTALEVTPIDASRAVGAIYPLKKGNDAIANGLVCNRLVVLEKSVSYAEYPEATSFKKYKVHVFSDAHTDGPVATLDVTPVAYADPNGRLTLKTHETKPRIGSTWVTPGVGNREVTEADVALASSEIAAWDQRLIGSIETAMYKIRTNQGGVGSAKV